MLDLKDTFFCIPGHLDSQFLFAFEWQDPSSQLTWTVIPQGFRDSPHLFGQSLAKDLSTLQLPRGSALLQYVDDSLICSPIVNSSNTNIILVLWSLASWGYKVSPSKAQISSHKFPFLPLRSFDPRININLLILLILRASVTTIRVSF